MTSVSLRAFSTRMGPNGVEQEGLTVITTPKHVQCVVFRDGPDGPDGSPRPATIWIGGAAHTMIHEIREPDGTWRPFTPDDARALVDGAEPPPASAVASTQCGACNGAGVVWGETTERVACAACGGTGLVRVQVGP